MLVTFVVASMNLASGIQDNAAHAHTDRQTMAFTTPM